MQKKVERKEGFEHIWWEKLINTQLTTYKYDTQEEGLRIKRILSIER